MMKKYNRPEIEALALEVIDVIETSGNTAAAEKMTSGEDAAYFGTTTVQVIDQNVADMTNRWQW